MTVTRSRPLLTAGVAVVALGCLVLPGGAKADAYVRAGIGFDASRSATFSDRDCASTRPPALFGCVSDAAGRPLGARGDFGTSPSLDIGIGYRPLRAVRVELALGWRPQFSFTGEANFLGTPGRQPVSADVEAITGMVVGYLDLVEIGVPRLGPFEPFVGAGAGVSRHRTSSVVYSFPGLGPGASTVVRGGETASFSYMLTAGAAWPVSERLTLDFAYRYLDLGTVRTASGPAVITRGASTTTIDVAGTEAALRTHGVSLSARLGF